MELIIVGIASLNIILTRKEALKEGQSIGEIIGAEHMWNKLCSKE